MKDHSGVAAGNDEAEDVWSFIDVANVNHESENLKQTLPAPDQNANAKEEQLALENKENKTKIGDKSASKKLDETKKNSAAGKKQQESKYAQIEKEAQQNAEEIKAIADRAKNKIDDNYWLTSAKEGETVWDVHKDATARGIYITLHEGPDLVKSMEDLDPKEYRALLYAKTTPIIMNDLGNNILPGAADKLIELNKKYRDFSEANPMTVKDLEKTLSIGLSSLSGVGLLKSVYQEAKIELGLSAKAQVIGYVYEQVIQKGATLLQKQFPNLTNEQAIALVGAASTAGFLIRDGSEAFRNVSNVIHKVSNK